MSKAKDRSNDRTLRLSLETHFNDWAANPPRAGERLERLLDRLMAGDRHSCRELVREFLDEGHEAAEAMHRLLWPACALLDDLSRRDQIAPIHHHCGTVLLSQLAQRLECALSRNPARGIGLLVASGPGPTEELAAELFSGLAEADGFETVFLGGGCESDDLYREIGLRKPRFFVSFAASGPDAPRLRRLIDAVRSQQPVAGLRLGVGVGVFLRAPCLADEIGADFAADTPFEMLDALRRLSGDPATCASERVTRRAR
ncbi:MAG: B12-binding domain-containing protein, partial [Planctomycetota bacterium]